MGPVLVQRGLPSILSIPHPGNPECHGQAGQVSWLRGWMCPMNPHPHHLSTASRPHWTEAAGTEGKTLPYPQPEGKQQKKHKSQWPNRPFLIISHTT